MESGSQEFLLNIKDLTTHFFTDDGIVRAVDGVSLRVQVGETLGLVGESGCGKSVTALSIMRLIQERQGRIVRGEINLAGRGDLTKLTMAEMRKIRGNEVSMIFQEPMTSLNPLMRVGHQIMEVIQLHQHLSKKDTLARSIEMLRLVGIPSPEKRIRDYPYQMSGGMRQRVMIAIALSCNPTLMLADEPTTALDVTIQAQILELMNEMKSRIGSSILLITHDLGVIAEMAQHVAVMYAGVIVESADIVTIFKNPKHPYTIGLLNSIPRMDLYKARHRRLQSIAGVVPSLLRMPKGCRFRDRCPYTEDHCGEEEPALVSLEEGHLVRCWTPRN